jgi:hypothetical protein
MLMTFTSNWPQEEVEGILSQFPDARYKIVPLPNQFTTAYSIEGEQPAIHNIHNKINEVKRQKLEEALAKDPDILSKFPPGWY